MSAPLRARYPGLGRDIRDRRPRMSPSRVKNAIWLMRATSRPTTLLRRLLQISDEVRAFGCVRHTRIGHAVGRHQFLRIGDEIVKVLRRPGEPAALERGRIAVVVKRTGLALEQAGEVGAHPITAAFDGMA